jgi:hypothetical protein
VKASFVVVMTQSKNWTSPLFFAQGGAIQKYFEAQGHDFIARPLELQVSCLGDITKAFNPILSSALGQIERLIRFAI